MPDDSPDTGGQPGATERRPVGARSWDGVRAFAAWLARAGISPNAISISSTVFAAISGAMLYLTHTFELGSMGERLSWIAAAIFIVARLFANVLDGLVAVEHGRSTPMGGVMNELPDRVSDACVLVGLGYATGGQIELGYTAACVALLIAYIRELGASQGAAHQFCGPMSKTHRMFTVIACCLVAGAIPAPMREELSIHGRGLASYALAAVIALGILTAIRRILRIRTDLTAKKDRA